MTTKEVLIQDWKKIIFAISEGYLTGDGIIDSKSYYWELVPSGITIKFN